MSEITRFSAVELAREIRQKRISPAEAVAAYLDRIERLNPALNAFVCVDAEQALAQARAAERALMKEGEVGPLYGVPISIKASIEVAGMTFDTGTCLRAGNKGQTDAPLVSRLKGAGAIVVGTTNTPEMLMAYETDNALHGRTNSPWDLERTPGGSSGGEAAAIAAMCSAAGVGSDGGGSIRVPAHFSGICGLKPTPGRIPATGHYPNSLGPFALIGVVGPMARTIEDVRILFEIMAGEDYADVSSAPVPLRRVSDTDARQMRIGYFEDDGHTPVTADTRATVQAAATELRKQGFDVRPFRSAGLDRARRAWWTFFVQCAGTVLNPLFHEREHEVSPIMREFLEIAAPYLPLRDDVLLNAWFERDQVRTEILAQMQEFPIVLCPTCAVTAFRHGERRWSIDGVSVGYLDYDRDVMSYSQWLNILGFPAAVVPVGRSPEGLPIGVQITGRPYQDEAVLAVAAAVDRAFGYQAPPMRWAQPILSEQRALAGKIA